MAVVTQLPAASVERPSSWRAAAATAARRMAAITAAGALLGLLVGGVGGRLAMLAIAQMNSEVAGLISDDGFPIGQFTLLGTLNLLAAGTVLGVLGAAIYAVLRPLVIGPPWFRVLSVGVGPAVVVGEQLVHTEGRDFTLLGPAWASIALFVLIPGVYAALLTVVAERWSAADGFFARGRLPLVLAPLLLFGPLLPLLAALAVAWALVEVVRRRLGGEVPGRVAIAWTGRAALAVLFCVALVKLVEETLVLT